MAISCDSTRLGRVLSISVQPPRLAVSSRRRSRPPCACNARSRWLLSLIPFVPDRIRGTGASRNEAAVASPSVVLRPQKMQRHIRLVAHHPAVMRIGRDVEQVSRAQFDHAAISERSGRCAGEDESDVLDGAPTRADRGTNVLRPLPPRLVGCPPDGEAAEADDLEPALDHLAD